MKNTIKVRTLLGQAIDTFEEYIKTKGSLQTDYPLEIYMKEILDYIDYLENKNKQLKDNWNKLKEYTNRYVKYDKNRRISKYLSAITIMRKMQELEQGNDK